MIKHTRFFLLAFVVGVISALVTIMLVKAILGIFDWLFHSFLPQTGAPLPWWQLLLIPALGGLSVGAILHYFVRGSRYHGISDVMEASTIRGGNMDIRSGVASALASVVSLGSGASLGREGPAIHLCATLSAWCTSTMGLNRSDTLILLGCGTAAAVTASFNAPVAGVLFALEVIIGYYSLRVLTPIVISTLGAFVVTRQWLGDSPAFDLHLPEYVIASFWELPVFAGIGIASGVTALLLIYCVRGVQISWDKAALPEWIRPMFGGLAVGLMALNFPEILGVGYAATDMALREVLPVTLLAMLLLAKLLATSVCLGSGFAGGVFSPALFIGAMLGGTIWGVADLLFPGAISNQGVYSIVGMAGVASALLGAPISTMLIIFELTADYQIIAAVMVSTAIASTVMQYSPFTSFFRWQLESRSVNLNHGRNQSLLMANTVAELVSQNMSRVDIHATVHDARQQLIRERMPVLVAMDGDRFMGSASLNTLPGIEQGEAPLSDFVNGSDIRVTPSTSLNGALALLDKIGLDCLPVCGEGQEEERLQGVVYRSDILRCYINALRSARDEEYGVN